MRLLQQISSAAPGAIYQCACVFSIRAIRVLTGDIAICVSPQETQGIRRLKADSRHEADAKQAIGRGNAC